MISTIDIFVIIAYIVGMLVIGYRVGKTNENMEDYLLANRSMPWIPVALSVAATMISANGFIGGPGWAYNAGLSPYMVNIGVPLAIAIAMMTSIPVFYRLRLTSIYEYMELRLGIWSRMLTVIGFLANSIIQVSSMVFIPALVLQVFTGWDMRLIVPIIVVTSIIYTLSGGIGAVIWTDVAQIVVLWTGLIACFIVIIASNGMDLFTVLADLKVAGKLQALDFSLDLTKTETFFATLIGGTVMWVRYFGFDQVQVQRVLTAKSLESVNKSLTMSAIVMNVMYFIFMLLGVLLYNYFDGRTFDNANLIMIEFISKHLPIGVVGLLIAGVFAIAMSSIDSLLNSMSSVFIVDIYQRFSKKDNGTTSLRFAQWVTFGVGIIVIFVTLFAFNGQVKSILSVVGSYISYISGPMCGAFVLAMFTTTASDKGVSIGVVLGFVFVIIISALYPISWIWKPFIGLVFTMAIGFIASVLFKDPKQLDRIHYTFKAQRLKPRDKEIASHLNKYVLITLSFFILQFVVLILIA